MPAKSKAQKNETTSKAKKSVSKKGQTGKRSKVKTSKKSEKAEKVVVKEEPVVVETPAVTETPVVVETPTVTETSDSTPRAEDALSLKLAGLRDSLSQVLALVKTIQGDIKSVEKDYAKIVKDHDKVANKRRSQSRKPSGFAKPSPLSDEMAEFLGLDKGVEIARNEVTKLINKYIVDNNLREEADKRKILPDKKLTKLLKLTGDENLSYFNLQKYIKHHFVTKTE